MGSAVSRRRWLAKKLARAGVANAAWASGALVARRFFAGLRVRAITYHRFGVIPGDPFCVTVDSFDAQMRSLAREGKLVSLDAIAEFLAGRRGLPPDSVLVTIDDGFRSVYREALPVLREYAVPAVAFVTAGLIGAPLDSSELPEPYLGWDELEALRRAGIAVGSHALDHCSLGRLADEELREQGSRSRELLERRLGEPIWAFAYPFGTRADFGPRTEKVLSECGYRWLFHSMHGAIRPGMDPLRLPRVKIEGGEGLRMFRLSCQGAMDAWWGVDHWLWRAQQGTRVAPERV